MAFKQEFGTLMVDKRFKEVGRIQRHSGTNFPTTLRAINATLDKLRAKGRIELLKDIQAKRITLLEVYNMDLVGKLESFSTCTDIRRLKSVGDGVVSSPLLDWVEKADMADTTRCDYRKRFMRFLQSVSQSATVTDLPRLLERFRESVVAKPRSFNALRTALQSFLRATAKPSNSVYKALTDVQPLPYKVARPSNPLSVREILSVCERMRKLDDRWVYSEGHPRHRGGEKAARMFWTLCLLGANWKEFEQDGWEIDKRGRRVVIHGQKRSGRERSIPLVDAKLTKPLLSLADFRGYLREATRGVVQVKDTRSTFAHWCAEAEIIDTHRQLYMGHGAKTMTDYYATSQRKRAELLEADGTKLRAYIERERVNVPTVTRGLGIVKSGVPFTGTQRKTVAA